MKETDEQREERYKKEEEERKKKITQICNELFGPFENIKESYLSMKFGQIPPKYHPHPKTIAKVRHMDKWPTSFSELETFYAYCYECVTRNKIHTDCKLSMKAITGSCNGLATETQKEYLLRERREMEKKEDK